METVTHVLRFGQTFSGKWQLASLIVVSSEFRAQFFFSSSRRWSNRVSLFNMLEASVAWLDRGEGNMGQILQKDNRLIYQSDNQLSVFSRVHATL